MPRGIFTISFPCSPIPNWEDKAANIRHIKSIIDIDYGAMMFLDDNPVERQLVRESFPTLCVPELPADPTEYVDFLTALNPFETASYTAQDAQRTGEYQTEARRHEEREKYVNPADFLGSLEMRAVVQPFIPFTFPRVAQLTQRSNQFNLRTVRYTEKEVEKLAAASQNVTLAFNLKDRFGDHGLVSVVILEMQGDAFFVDTWLMSCRVLGRGMEQFVLNRIMAQARQSGIKRVVGEYLPTPKNKLVEDHYAKLGFTATGDNRWTLETAPYQERSTHITLDETAANGNA